MCTFWSKLLGIAMTCAGDLAGAVLVTFLASLNDPVLFLIRGFLEDVFWRGRVEGLGDAVNAIWYLQFMVFISNLCCFLAVYHDHL